jgi:hypothetical protein
LVSHSSDKYELMGVSPQKHIALEFNPQKMVDASGRCQTAPHPRGMSGGPVWKVIRTEINGRSVMAFRLAGIAIEFKQSKRTLIATRIIAPLEGIRTAYPNLSQNIPKNPAFVVVCRGINEPGPGQ